MNEVWRRPVDLRSPLLALVAAASGVSVGIASARSLVPLALLAGSALLGWLVFAPASMALGSVLIVRGFTDASAGFQLGGIPGLNPGSLLGLVVMLVTALRLLGTKQPRGLLIAIGAMLVLAIWTLLAIARYGVTSAFVQEFVRTGSIIAVGLMAANPGKSFSPSRITTAVVLAAMFPALWVIGEAGFNWEGLLNDGFRPRGPISHPNAAAIFFSVALVMALWKRIYGGGGQWYLLAGALILVAILATRSIGGLMQTVATLIVFVTLQRGNTGHRILVGLAAMIIIVLFVTDPFGLSRVGDLQALSDSQEQSSATWRLANWSAFLNIWQEEPLLGYGLGSTAELIRPLGREAHNEVVRLLVETGIVGLSLFATAHVLIVAGLFRRSRSGRDASFSAAVLAAVLGITAHAFVTDAFDNTGPMYLIAALVGTAFATSAAPARQFE